MDKPVLVALVAYAMIALILTRGVLVDSGLSVFQKIIQAIIIWVIPVFGMSIVLLMQGNNHTRAEMKGLVPFPFYLAAPAHQSDGSLSSYVQDGAGDNCGPDVGDGD
jgi:hypothetical protein